jgi:hypothetical protein
LCLLSFDQLAVGGLLHFQVALRLSLPRQGGRLGHDALLIGLRLSNRGFPQGNGALDRGIAIRLGGGHVGIAFDAGDVRAPHVGDVLVFVPDFLDGKRDYVQAHLVHIVGAGRTHAVGDHLGLFDDLLHRELSDDSPQVSLHYQANQSVALLRAFGQELLRRSQDRLRIGFDLDLRDRFHRNRDSLFGVEVLLRRDVKGHQLQRQFAAVLDHRQDHRAMPLNHTGAAKAVHHQRLVRSGLAIQPGQNGHQQH